MPYPDGSLLKASDNPAVYLIEGGQRHWIPSPDIFNTDGFSWSAVLTVSDAEIAAYAQGPDVPMYTTWVTPGPNDASLPGLPALPVVQYGSVEYKRWRSANGGHTIYAEGQYVTQAGVFRGGTVTSNSVMFTGYHSGTSAIATDGPGHILWSSPVFRVGVNPQGLSGIAQVSVNAWSFQVPVNIADQVGGIGIIISDSPDNLSQIMAKSVGALVSDLAPAISAIGGLLTGSKKSGSTATGKTTTSATAQERAWESIPNGIASGVNAQVSERAPA